MDDKSIKYNNKFRIKEKILITTILVILLLIIITTAIFIINKIPNKIEHQVNTTNELSISTKLELDYNQGIITTDEYVRYNLYAEYDNDLLSEEYALLNGKEVSIHTDELVEEYYDELSDETLKYYLDKINLDNITFELDKENENTNNESDKLALANLFVDTVYADSEDITNLNKAILSKNGNFIIWYTTTGNSATNYDTAKKIADGLEKTVETYDNLFESDYSFSSNILSKGKTYKNQIKILDNSNIDSRCLESAMQVYLVNYTKDNPAKYVRGYTTLSELWNKIKGGDEYGSISFPYILIKPSSFSDLERLEQLYNHELFHHYQYNMLCGSSDCNMGSDPYIAEATANWASAMATNKTTNKGFLNEWAGTARIFSSDLMSDDWSKKHGIENVGYALFVYLANYQNIVENGTSQIIDAIYKDDALKYLEENSYTSDREKVQRNILLNNLSQNYSNKNLNVSTEMDANIKIKDTISTNKSINDIIINRIGIDYYLLSGNSDENIKITLKGNDSSYGTVYAYVITEQKGNFEIIDSKQYFVHDTTIEIANKKEYDKLYLVIANSSLVNTYTYSFEVEKNKIIEKGKYSLKCTDDDYIVYFDMNDEFVLDSKYTLTNSRNFSNNKDVKNGTRTNIYFDFASNSSFEYIFDITKDSFYEDSYNYKNVYWNDKITELEINNKKVQYVYGKYTENGTNDIIYNDGQDNYDVVSYNNVIVIESLINLEENHSVWMTIYLTSEKEFNSMGNIEDVLKRILNTNFVIEETN